MGYVEIGEQVPDGTVNSAHTLAREVSRRAQEAA